MIKKIIYNIFLNMKVYWFLAVLSNAICTLFVTAIYILSVRMVIYFYHHSNSINEGLINFKLNIFNTLFFFFLVLFFIYVMNLILKFTSNKIVTFLNNFKTEGVSNWQMFQSRLLKIILDLPLVFLLGIILFLVKFQFAILVFILYFILFISIVIKNNKLINSLDTVLIRAFLDISTILIFIILALFFNIFNFEKEILATLVCVFGTRLSNALFVSSTNCFKGLKKQVIK